LLLEAFFFFNPRAGGETSNGGGPGSQFASQFASQLGGDHRRRLCRARRLVRVRRVDPLFDGLASIGIGLLLAGVGAVIARETKGLLIGESASSKVDRSITAIAENEPDIEQANGVLTFQLGPSEVVVVLSLEFADDLRTPEIESIARAEDSNRAS
jgi:hypothetical protein